MVTHPNPQLVELPKQPLSARNLVGGQWIAGSEPSRQLSSPYSGEVLGTIHPASLAEADQCVAAASSAFDAWRQVPAKERAAALLKLREVMLRDIEKLSHSAARESGKLVGEARAEVLKGVEVLEFAASLPNSDLGGALEVSRGVTCEYRREPLGVTVGITPFNFPAMVPMWMIPISLAIGNSFILKPSDKVPFRSGLPGRRVLRSSRRQRDR